MNWDAFLAAIGHSAQVWSAFILCFALMAVEVLRLSRRIRNVRFAVSVEAFEVQQGAGQSAHGEPRRATAGD